MEDPLPFRPFLSDCWSVAINDSLRSGPLLISDRPILAVGELAFLGFRLSESVRAGGRGGFLGLRREMERDSDPVTVQAVSVFLLTQALVHTVSCRSSSYAMTMAATLAP